MSEIKKISGLVAAPFTPMHDDGRLNLGVIPAYAELLQQDQVNAVFVCGSTGEGPSLTFEEKIQVMQAWAATTFNKIMLVGGTSLEECKHLARKASDLGYAGISFVAPYYFKPGSPEILADCCAEVAAAAPDLPFYYYHIPVLSGVNMPMLPLLEAVANRIPNFAGIKYTQEDLMDYAQCVQFQNQRYDLLWGRDEVMLSALAMGAKGAVGSTFNYAAPIYHALMDCFEKNDLEKALEYQHQSIEIVRLLGKYGGIRVGKAFMRARGIDCGHFRLPIPRMTENVYQTFLKEVESIGFFEWIKPNYAFL
ncbi:dihydrodipicolinate synthase family protein [Haliscomenobacter hydrossis]|uniref:N-acetylneuraminate lyase n=1 Tax=Haliscomenobacter hydrossis (strain ATCC 27775 / DSM 1100 / LMG 10767 / O) TaxID=760192 RepID=F4KT95_HALH1|nr:dihydrodipicolinate synthase family protein [Haliscomenobacter hydrossis]AEE51152.1 N-acetylneuraminate lyase [Haliscomenobacter hydrossis DSM 1100]